MKITVTTHLDPMGRIVIPKDIRRVNGWEINDLLNIESDEMGNVSLYSVTPRCCVCGALQDLEPVKNKFICKDCLASIK